jgi:hypothetical protein
MQNQNLPQTLEITFKDLPIIIHALEKEADYCKKRRQECKLLGSEPESINYWNSQYKLCIDIVNRLNTDV